MEKNYPVSDKIEYSVFLINDFARHFNISPKQSFDYLDSYGGISFINRNYGIAHTQSFEDMVENLVLVCKRNGGNL